MARAFPSRSSWCMVMVLAAVGAAEARYGLRAAESTERVSRDLVAKQLFSELTAMLGHDARRERLTRIETLMRPSYTGLPKNKHGGIDQAVSRYALHRYFVMHRGWHIRGLAPDGEKWNASSSTAMLKSKMPTFILELLEESVGRRHIGLGELAVLAATVEDLVHGDTIELLRMAYGTHGLSVHEPLASIEQEQRVIKTYLLYFLLPWTQEAQDNATEIVEFFPEAPAAYPGWDDTVLWVEDLKESIKYQNRGEHNPFEHRDEYFRHFASMAHLAETIIDKIGMFQDIECRMIKNLLLDLEERNDGRVLLTKFWGPYMKDEHYYFTETPAFLKNLGALDDADPLRPSVIVPNIIYARSNCLATSSSFHSVCCVDQCNVLMETLERNVAHGVARPGLIAELVAALPSDTVAAPRNLSGSLRRKLDMIAARHSGHVPLHGRMFALWMHHAFPNECPFPHASGTEAPMTHDEWSERFGDSLATDEEMRRYMVLDNSTTDVAKPQEVHEDVIMWSEEEELVTQLDMEELSSLGQEGYQGTPALLSLLRLVAMAAAGFATIGVFWESIRSSISLVCPRLGIEKSPCSLPRWFSEAGRAGAAKSHFV
mmetsp:Transcript_109401/g.275205  ORF Transcript_109401/g.275205 Transcript_109401/m.275205 type:complete len:601 (+) Transcript_109401:72-1874(+)